MTDKILHAMAADLKIKQYTNETSIQYCNRILYSALACWIKTTALDRPIGSIPNSGVSRRHIFDRCSTVFDELLTLCPGSMPWFSFEKPTEHPVSVIRSRLIRNGDLLNVGFDTNLILARKSVVAISDNLEVHHGIIYSPEVFYTGVATVAQSKLHFSKTENNNSVDWLKEYIKRAWWEKVAISDASVQYYYAKGKSRNNYKLWQSSFPEEPTNVVLARRSVNVNDYEYFLVKGENRNYIHRIDPLLHDLGEHRRFIFALRSMVNNKPPCEILVYQDHVHIKLWSYLPQAELSLLESYAWPHSSISDVLEWDMPHSIWQCIEPKLRALGLEIMEAYNG